MPLSARHAVLALNRVRPLKELSARLSPKHIRAARCGQFIGGIRLAALELLDRQWPLKALNVLGEPCRELDYG
jgi:hypothetical protein